MLRLFSLAALSAISLAVVTCSPARTFIDSGPPPRDVQQQPDAAPWIDCVPGQVRCDGERFQRCLADGELTRVETDDCGARQQACVDPVGCMPCRIGQLSCTPDEGAVLRCADDMSGFVPDHDCDTVSGLFCRGGMCRTLCDTDDVVGTNIGCEYYAADLDNAQLGAGESAASQQYSVVVSNPDPIHTARVRIEWNTAPQGENPRTAMVASAVIPPNDLESFPLPAREVDCSAPGTFNTGTGTCLSSQAYRITSTIPVIAFQFNPFQNEYAFSNDASMLIPTNSVQGDYLVMGWPQTLASSPPEIVLNPTNPNDLRGFVTIVGTRAGTHLHVVPRADVLPGGPLTSRGLAGQPIDITLGAFDVFNLETDGFLADLTGTVVQADGPVVVFSGSECSDVPAWMDLNDRRCCCDHLEAQQFPRNTVGTHYIATHTPYRTRIVHDAGAPIAVIDREPEYFRVLAVTAGSTHVRTTLPSMPDDIASAPLEFDLMEGEVRTLTAYGPFEVNANAPVSVASFMSSQGNTGIPLSYPGGDGSFIPQVAIEQWRTSYVFLVPQNYAFDFVQIVAPAGTDVRMDGEPLPPGDCEHLRGDGCVTTLTHTCPPSQYDVYNCQLSYPRIDPSLPYPQNLDQGRQGDGVHSVTTSAPSAVQVTGFDLRVSYGYPAGARLRPLF